MKKCKMQRGSAAEGLIDLGFLKDDLAREFARALTRTNPLFNADKFIEACLGE